MKPNYVKPNYVLDSWTQGHRIEYCSTQNYFTLYNCPYVRLLLLLLLLLFSVRTYFISTDSVHVKFVEHNLKASHRRHICNIDM
jgi:hypothetical protein